MTVDRYNRKVYFSSFCEGSCGVPLPHGVLRSAVSRWPDRGTRMPARTARRSLCALTTQNVALTARAHVPATELTLGRTVPWRTCGQRRQSTGARGGSPVISGWKVQVRMLPCCHRTGCESCCASTLPSAPTRVIIGARISTARSGCSPNTLGSGRHDSALPGGAAARAGAGGGGRGADLLVSAEVALERVHLGTVGVARD